MRLVDDLKHYLTDVHFDPRRPLIAQEFTKSMFTAVNILKHEILLPQPLLQYDLPRDDRMHDRRRAAVFCFQGGHGKGNGETGGRCSSA